MKKCTVCKREKDESEFGRIKTVKSGLAARCKTCAENYRKEYKAKNPERFKFLCKKQREKHYKENKLVVLEKNKQWYEQNKESVLENQRKYANNRYIEKREEILSRNKEWRKKNKEKTNEMLRDYRKNNPKKVKEFKRSYFDKFPEKVKAGNLIRNKILDGSMTKPTNCTRCLSVGLVEGHHPDYSKPLEVIWLCRKCHNKEHGN